MHSHSRAALTVVFGAVLALGSQHPAAQGKDPILGNWELDVQKSTFAGQRPVKRTMMFAPVPNGLKETITTTTNGLAEITYHLTYTAKFDGKDYPADVASSLDTVSLKRVDDHTIERIGKVKGQVMQTETYMVSPDGKMLTVKQEGKNNGVMFKSSQVFERDTSS